MKAMDYKKLTREDCQFFKLKLGEENVATDSESLESHGSDETEDLRHPRKWCSSPKTPNMFPMYWPTAMKTEYR
jgi:hypothetical protein